MLKPFELGQRLGAYEIIRLLGTGGMGQVYEAEHVKLGVRRALKVFSTDSEHCAFLRKRFDSEGRILADLEHPRVVRVYDFDVDKTTGVPYFAMDLVISPNGEPQTMMGASASGIEEGQIVQWLRDICEGLAYIHSKGVVHRDISLENILLDRDGHAVITDFGIAKITDDDYRRKINVTVTMAVKDAKDLCMGKGDYMAPELKNGLPATPASDAYALGVLLFRMLTGCWYDPDGNTNLKEMFAAMEYDWAFLLGKLLNANPVLRLPNGDIGVLPDMLKPTERHWSGKWKALASVLSAILLALAASAFWFTRRDRPPAAEQPSLMRTNATMRTRQQKVNPAVFDELENAILTPVGNASGEPDK